jgi:hypothetical protein
MKPPTLHELHTYSVRKLTLARSATHGQKLTRDQVRELQCAETLPVLLGYLRTVRTGKGKFLAELLIEDTILHGDYLADEGEEAA